MKQTAHQKHFKICLTNNLKVFSLDRYALESILPPDGRFKIEDIVNAGQTQTPFNVLL